MQKISSVKNKEFNYVNQELMKKHSSFYYFSLKKKISLSFKKKLEKDFLFT